MSPWSRLQLLLLRQANEGIADVRHHALYVTITPLNKASSRSPQRHKCTRRSTHGVEGAQIQEEIHRGSMSENRVTIVTLLLGVIFRQWHSTEVSATYLKRRQQQGNYVSIHDWVLWQS